MKIEILRIEGGKRKNVKDEVVEESLLTVHLNGREIATLMCSPGNLKELSVGFLFSSGLLPSGKDIERISLNSRPRECHVNVKGKFRMSESIPGRRRLRGSSGGVLFCAPRSARRMQIGRGGFKMAAGRIKALMKSFEKKSSIFKKTGGVHSAALSAGGKLLIFQEDIGRHNALDKVIGAALLKKIDMRRCLFLTSGRISSEIVSKVLKTGSAFIISPSAPTAPAVRLARKQGITLIGFARGERMNVYSGEKSIEKN